MTIELTLLLWSVVLYGLYLGAQAGILRLQRGIEFASSARDNAPAESHLEARADRALKNFQETWPVFIILILVAHLSGPGDAFVFWGAIVWFVSRVAYLPLYLAGTYLIRSLVWNVTLLGLLLMGWGVLF
jgi:uncharacterized MAPEG superfamily protein